MSSDRNGRAFEAIVLEYLVDALKHQNISAELTHDAINIQRQYLLSFNQLAEDSKINKTSRNLYMDYLTHVPQLIEWIVEHFTLKQSSLVIIDKLKDSDAIGNVADLKLTVHKDNTVQIINLSLKNNHEALRHFRIRPLPSWLGYDKDHPIRNDFNKKLDEVQHNVMTSIKLLEEKLNIVIKTYDDLEQVGTDHSNYSRHYKINFIYPNFYEVIMNFFKENIRDSNDVNRLYNYFLSSPHYKIINYAKARNSTFEIYDFTNVENLENLETKICEESGYLLFIFDGKFVISLRLHNDKSIIADSFNFKCDIMLSNIHMLPINHYTLVKRTAQSS